MPRQPSPSQGPDIDAAIRSAARAAGMSYPDDAARLVDRSEIAVTPSGRVLGVDEAVKRLRREKPGLFRASAAARPASVAPHSIEDRALRLINEFSFLFDPSHDLATVATAMADLGGMGSLARQTLINRMTTPCHWASRYGPGGLPAEPDWSQAGVRKAMLGERSPDEVAGSRALLEANGGLCRYG